MAAKNTFLKVMALIAIVGVPALLVVGAVYDVLTPREFAIVFFGCVAAILSWAAVGKSWQRRRPLQNAESAIALDDAARKRILRQIRERKVWIGILVVLLPIGIANGVTHHAWLPTWGGAAISLLLMYAAAQGIRQRRKSLSTRPRTTALSTR